MTVKELIHELMEHDMDREVYIDFRSDELNTDAFNFEVESAGSHNLILLYELKGEVIVDKSEYKNLIEFMDEHDEPQ